MKGRGRNLTPDRQTPLPLSGAEQSRKAELQRTVGSAACWIAFNGARRGRAGPQRADCRWRPDPLIWGFSRSHRPTESCTPPQWLQRQNRAKNSKAEDESHNASHKQSWRQRAEQHIPEAMALALLMAGSHTNALNVSHTPSFSMSTPNHLLSAHITHTQPKKNK